MNEHTYTVKISIVRDDELEIFSVKLIDFTEEEKVEIINKILHTDEVCEIFKNED